MCWDFYLVFCFPAKLDYNSNYSGRENIELAPQTEDAEYSSRQHFNS